MKEVKEDMQDYKKEIVSDDSQNEKPTCSKFERVLERYIYLKSADNFSSVRFSPCLRRFCLILGLEALDMTCMQTPSPYPVRSRGFDLSINEEC